MSSSSSDKSLITAVAAGSAVLGATLAVAAMKLMDSSSKDKSETYKISTNQETKFTSSFQARNPSIIFNDQIHEPILLPHNHEEKMKRRIAQRVAVEQENSLPRKSVTVKVPATTANMGPGCKYCRCW